MTTRFKLSGLTCEACVKISKLKISKIYGVKQIDIDLKSGQASIEADRAITLAEVKMALHGTEYGVEIH